MTMDGMALQRVHLVFRDEIFHSVPFSEAVCIAAIPTRTATLLCLCALRRHKKSLEVIESVHGGGCNAVSLFLGAMLLSIENLYFTPSYLKTLGDSQLTLLKRLSSFGIAEDLNPSDVRMARSVDLFNNVPVVERLAG
jgi:hypothetical protein